MATTASQDATQFEESLRNQLMGAQNGSHQSDNPTPPQSGPAPYPVNARSPQGNDARIDPSIGGGGPTSPPGQLPYMNDMMMDDSDPNGKGRRELSTTKRAAQNRAAQRAFRQRKEAYISKLEKQVKDYVVMEEDFKIMQHENYQLREYILALQTRILESSNELPPPPARIHLVHPHEAQRHHQARAQAQVQGAADHNGQHSPSQHLGQEGDLSTSAPTASMTAHGDTMSEAAVQQLQAAAAEAGNLGGDAKREL